VKADLSFVAGAMPGGDAVAKKSFFFPQGASARRRLPNLANLREAQQ